MIQTIKITNPNSEQLSLVLRTSEQDHGILVFNLEGLGSPKATVSGLSGPTYDGIRGYFVIADARHILLTLAVSSRGDAEEVSKKKIYDYFPVKEQIKFQVLTDTTEVYIWAIVESVEMNQFSKVENAVISLYCPDPYFMYLAWTITWAFYGSSKAVPYDGDVPVGGIFTFYCPGPLGDWITMENVLTDEEIVLLFASIGGGDVFDHGDKIILNTRLGQKSIKLYTYNDVFKTNMLSCIDSASDWPTFMRGDNPIAMTADVPLGTPDADRPSPSQLVACIPFNEWYQMDEDDEERPILEWHNDYDFTIAPSEDGIPVFEEWNQMYTRSRCFITANESYISGPSPVSALCPTADFSINVWFRATTIASAKRIIVSNWDAMNGFEIRHNSSNKIEAAVKVGGTIYSVEYTDAPTVGIWEMYTIRHQASPSYLRITKNAFATVSTACPAALGSYTGATLEIGGTVLDGDYLDARLQMFTLHDLLLSDAEMTWLYRGGWGRKYGDLSGAFEIEVSNQAKFQGV